MEDKESIEILINMLEKYSLAGKEKQAVQNAIGALGWTKLGKGRMENIIRARKAEKEQDLKGHKSLIDPEK